jgi:magnesium transporter
VTVSCRVYREGHLEAADVDLARVPGVLREPRTMVWVDVPHPTPTSMAVIQRAFGFHELAIEDCLGPHQRPKIEQYEDYFFLVAYQLTVDADAGLQGHELAAFVSHRYLVTVRKDPELDLTETAKRWEAHPERLCEGGGYPLYVLLDQIVDGYFVALDDLEDRGEQIEELVLGGDGAEARAGATDSRMQIFQLRRELFRARRAAAPLRDVLDALQRRTLPVVSQELEPYYRDVYDHVLRATDFIDNLRDILSSAFDAHLSAVSNRLNEVMKVLTSWAGIILVPTLIAGIYGMNFVHMPELTWRYGYAYALAVMFGAGFLLWRMFHKRGWL